MSPIYFPFTWVDPAMIQTLTALFPKVVVYQPSVSRTSSLLKPLEQAGTLEIRVPVTEDSIKLKNLVADYQDWARLHQGNDLSFLKRHQPGTPFVEGLSSRIQSEILHYQEAPTGSGSDPVFNARLFLEFAAAYDAQQAELTRDLANIHNLEKRFMAALGDPAEMAEAVLLGNEPLFEEDPRDFMLAERLQAWATLLLQDRWQLQAASMWITSRLSVVEWIRDEADMEPVLEINCLPVQKTIDDNRLRWQENIMAYLMRLQETPWPSAIQTFEPPAANDAWENAVSVNGFILPKISPEALLQKMAADKAARRPNSGAPRNTLLICVTPV